MKGNINGLAGFFFLPLHDVLIKADSVAAAEQNFKWGFHPGLPLHITFVNMLNNFHPPRPKADKSSSSSMDLNNAGSLQNYRDRWIKGQGGTTKKRKTSKEIKRENLIYPNCFCRIINSDGLCFFFVFFFKVTFPFCSILYQNRLLKNCQTARLLRTVVM